MGLFLVEKGSRESLLGGYSLRGYGWIGCRRRNLQRLSLKPELLSTLWAIPTITLDCFTGGLKLEPRVERLATLRTRYLLWGQVIGAPLSLKEAFFPVDVLKPGWYSVQSTAGEAGLIIETVEV